MIVGDEPRSWLEEPKARVRKASAKSPGTPDKPTGPAQLPADLDGLRNWLLSADSIDVPKAGRLDAIGDPASGLMILVDMPDRADAEAGTLLSGETGLLFDRMLAAIGRDRASTYVAALSPARITGGAVDVDNLESLGRIAKHHVALAQPERLLVMGDAPSRVFCGASLNESRGSQHNFNHDGGTVSVTATFHPRFLLQQPRLKAQSWKDLQMMIEGMTA
ncbi:MAG: uracil-DNA glycosylase family protein [Parasphingopyxis sp.]